MATFEEVNNQILSLSTLPNVDFFVVGYSLLGKPIYGAHIGNYDGNQILLEGAIHAREWVTAPLLVDMVKYLQNTEIPGGMYFIPMSNPDGVKLVLDGANDLPCEQLRRFLLSVNGNNSDFSQWKANANAVDLNVNLIYFCFSKTLSFVYFSLINFIIILLKFCFCRKILVF